MRKTVAGLITATALAAAVLVGLPTPAHAATAWFVRVSGPNTGCTSVATACPTITSVLAKPTFAAGDTIDVGPGQFNEHPVITKAVTITGAGASTTPGPTVTTINGGGTAAAPINTFQIIIPPADPNRNVVINNLSITGGLARLGGGIQLQGGLLSLSDDVIYNNTAGTTTLGSGSTGGGAIATFGKILGSSSTLALTRTTITGNFAKPIGTASVPGAGIFLLSPMTALDSTISNNVITAGTSGGTNAGAGIYMSKLVTSGANIDTTSLDADHTTFSGNVDNGGLGGAIGANSGPPITIRNNSTMSGGSAVDGGAIFTTGPSAVTINNSTVSGNAVTFQGGAVFMQQTVGTDAPTFTATTTAFTSNTAANAGGAVILYPGVTGTITGGSFGTNSAPYAGALYVVKGGTTGVNGTSFTGNTARAVAGAATSGEGGAIFGSGVLNIVGGSFTNNIANGVPVSGTAPVNSGNGGAIYSDGQLTINNASGSTAFTGNRALGNGLAAGTPNNLVSGWGGSIYSGPAANNDAPTNIINDASFTGDATTQNSAVGGGVAIVGNATLSNTNLALTGTTPATLSAARNTYTKLFSLFGGGLYAGGGGTQTMDASTFDGNLALQGGGIDVQSTVATETPVLALTNSTVKNGLGTSVGGGVVVQAKGTLNATGSTLDTNSSFLGGGLYVVENGVANLTNSTVNNNTATGGATANGGDGGGVFNAGTLLLTKSTVSNNKAIASTGTGGTQPARGTGFGGGIYAGSSVNNNAAKTTIDSSTLNGNSANTGSALISWLASGNTGQTNPVSITNSTVSNNATTTGSGSIVTAFPISIVASTIADNTAPVSGQTGAMYLVSGSRIAGSIVSANTAAGCGIVAGWVVPTDGGYNQSDPGDGTCGFTAIKHDISALPQLGALAANGGPTQTRRPGNSSPVINVIPTSTATGITDAVTSATITLCVPASLDQRGSVRPSGDLCDIGSVEITSSAPTITGPTSDTVTVGQVVSYAYSTTGVPTPTITMTGTLPSGVTFASTPGSGTATISGTPAAGSGGSYTVTLTAANGASPSATLTFNLVVNEGPTLTGPSAATYVVGAAGAPQTFKATSNPTATLSETGALPNGVTFVDNHDGTATLSGTPAAGTGAVYPIVVKATNGVGTDPTLNFTLTVNEAPSITGTTPLTYTAGTPIASEPYTGSGYPKPAMTGTGVPNGLTFTDNGGGNATLTGTPAAGSGGVHTMTITAANGIGSNATLDVTITINEAPQVTGPTSRNCQVLTSCGPDTFNASGYPGSTLTLSGDTLPSGMSFTGVAGSSTATINGTPAAGTGGIYNFTITATNSAGSGIWAYKLTIGQPPTVSGPSTATYEVGSAGPTLTYTATGFPTPSLSASGLPSGVTLTDHGNGTATIDGTPAPGTGGIKNVVITASNGIGSPATTPLALSVNEAPAINGPTAATYVVSQLGTPQTFTTTGYPRSDLSETGALPDGVTFADNGDGTATLSGTPAAHMGGVYPITVHASNTIGAGAIWSFTLTVNEAPTISGPTTARLDIDTPATLNYTTTGFPDREITLEGDLPSGMFFLDNGDNTASLTGTPDFGTEGVYTVVITADNGVNPAATLTLTLTVVAPVTVTTGDLTDAAVGTPYSVQLTAVGGQPPYTWSTTGGTLPPGITVSPAGVLGGTPTGPAGTFTFTVQAKDSLTPAHVGTKQLTLVVGRGATKLYAAPAVLKLQGLKIKLLTVSASLLNPTGGPIAGQTITFKAGTTTVCTAVTNATGRAGCDITVPSQITTILNLGYTASYAGNAFWQPADAASGIIS